MEAWRGMRIGLLILRADLLLPCSRARALLHCPKALPHGGFCDAA